ncbi:MAG: hypothetical protein ACTHJ8_15725 [Mucilaginibacter sp.]
MSEYWDPEDEKFDDFPSREPDTSSEENKKGNLESEGPNKDQDFKVLHKDGSLSERLPDKEAAGSGALDGTVGRGT